MLFMAKIALKELSQNIEGGKANPSLDVILKIFKALKMEIQ